MEDRDALREEIRELNKVTVNTTAVKDSINALIKSSGFQGFYLREKAGTQYVYELVRDNGNGQPVSIARGLSEGERHFIAFLYFYHTVIGSQSDDGRTVPKIVVIDDPVSSLDSESMFIVAALTRELIGICYNNFRMSFSGNQENYIKQFFCLTHNPYFFREVSYSRLGEFECASFFEIKKHKGNQSTVEPCTEKSHEVGGRIINRNPVRNYYDSLWADYKTEDKPETLMNIIRQILEYYFIQMCGYKTGNLRNDLLDKNEDIFVHMNEDGTKNRTDYILAAAMISLLDSGAAGFNEGLFFDSSSADPDQMRDICRRLFELKGQQQHYYMMYGEDAENMDIIKLFAKMSNGTMTELGIFNLLYFGAFSFGSTFISGYLRKYFKDTQVFDITMSKGLKKATKRDYQYTLIAFVLIVVIILGVTDVLPVRNAVVPVMQLLIQLAQIADGFLLGAVLVTMAILSMVYKYICTVLEYDEKEL